jgi:hypothetical protein
MMTLDHTLGSCISSRTSCAVRHAAANLEAQVSFRVRGHVDDGETAQDCLRLGERTVRDRSVRGDHVCLLGLQPGAGDPHSGLLSFLNDLVRRPAHILKVLVGNDHGSVIE